MSGSRTPPPPVWGARCILNSEGRDNSGGEVAPPTKECNEELLPVDPMCAPFEAAVRDLEEALEEYLDDYAEQLVGVAPKRMPRDKPQAKPRGSVVTGRSSDPASSATAGAGPEDGSAASATAMPGHPPGQTIDISDGEDESMLDTMESRIQATRMLRRQAAPRPASSALFGGRGE